MSDIRFGVERQSLVTELESLVRQVMQLSRELVSVAELYKVKAGDYGVSQQPSFAPAELPEDLIARLEAARALLADGRQIEIAMLQQAKDQYHELRPVSSGDFRPIEKLFPPGSTGKRKLQEGIIVRSLRKHGFTTINQVVTAEYKDVYVVRNMGSYRWAMVDEALEKLGLRRQTKSQQNGEP